MRRKGHNRRNYEKNGPLKKGKRGRGRDSGGEKPAGRTQNRGKASAERKRARQTGRRPKKDG